MEKVEIWVGVWFNHNRHWADLDYAIMFYSKVDAEKWVQSIKSICSRTGCDDMSIYISKIPTDVDFLMNEVEDGKEI